MAIDGIATPGKIIAVHLNYPSRAAQRGRTPAAPSYFFKPASSLAATGGVRGVGASLARSSRWNRVPAYLANASSTVSLTVQVESAAAVAAVDEILAVDGVDAIFVGPADLAASMGRLGEPSHPDVVEAVLTALRAAVAAGTASTFEVGAGRFDPREATRLAGAVEVAEREPVPS